MGQRSSSRCYVKLGWVDEVTQPILPDLERAFACIGKSIQFNTCRPGLSLDRFVRPTDQRSSILKHHRGGPAARGALPGLLQEGDEPLRRGGGCLPDDDAGTCFGGSIVSKSTDTKKQTTYTRLTQLLPQH